MRRKHFAKMSIEGQARLPKTGSAIKIVVKGRGQGILGTFRAGRGSLMFAPKRGKKSVRIAWPKLIELITNMDGE